MSARNAREREKSSEEKFDLKRAFEIDKITKHATNCNRKRRTASAHISSIEKKKIRNYFDCNSFTVNKTSVIEIHKIGWVLAHTHTHTHPYVDCSVFYFDRGLQRGVKFTGQTSKGRKSNDTCVKAESKNLDAFTDTRCAIVNVSEKISFHYCTPVLPRAAADPLTGHLSQNADSTVITATRQRTSNTRRPCVRARRILS